jgi:hypothetical protein
MSDVVSLEHLRDAALVRAALETLESTRELRRAGLADLTEPALASALAAEGALLAFVHCAEPAPPAETLARLRELAAGLRR